MCIRDSFYEEGRVSGQGAPFYDGRLCIQAFDGSAAEGKLFRISVQQAKSGDAKLLTMKKSQKQRCRLVQRSDILPMVQYVAARHYMEMQKTEEEYSSTDARQLFVNMAAEVLKRCDMAPLDKHYRLDHILLSCFETGEVSYMSELLEIVMELI